MNQLNLYGRMAADPEIRVTESEKTVATFRIAVNRPFKNKEGKYDADFFPCVAFGKSAEFIGNNFQKGDRILLYNARLQNRSYEKDGQKRYITEVIVDRVEFGGDKQKDGQTGNMSAPGAHMQQRTQQAQGPMGAFGQEMGFNEEVPF